MVKYYIRKGPIELERKTNPVLKCFEPMVDCIADLFGSNCEVVLHDISDLDNSIIKIRNGHVTGRKPGDSMTDVGLEMIEQAKNGRANFGIYSPRTKTGKVLISNAINIFSPKGKHVGILCINLDVSEFVQLQKKIQNFCGVAGRRDQNVREEHFESNIRSIVQESIDNMIKEKGISVHNLTKRDRLEIIDELNKKGFFFIRGAVRQVSKSLGISSPTLYKYLEEIRFPLKETPMAEGGGK